MDIEDDLDADQERRLWGKAIFLPRNVKQWHERVGHNKSDMPQIDSCDETECKFSLNSYKMVFVMGRESYLYKRKALEKAKLVSSKEDIFKFKNILTALEYLLNCIQLLYMYFIFEIQ